MQCPNGGTNAASTWLPSSSWGSCSAGTWSCISLSCGVAAGCATGYIQTAAGTNTCTACIGNGANSAAAAFVAGGSYTVADIDLMILIDFAKWLKMGLPEDAPNARRWYEAVSSRPSAKL